MCYYLIVNKLKDFESEINKCSKCGLCQSVCPVYKITGNDCAVSRGKFVMLDGVLKGDLKLSKTINKYLDMCLKCGKCKDFCPSGIDVCKIFETAKYEYAKNTILGKIIFFLESKWVFGNVLKILSSPLIRRFATPSPTKGEKEKLLYFKGCANYILPHTDKLLKSLSNIEIIEKDFDCCGLPFLSSGNLERFEEVKVHNLKQLENIDYDYIFTDCASCESTLKEYLPSNFINIGELLIKLGLKFKSKKTIRVTFHKPCHLENTDFLEPLLANCENVEYIEMPDFDECCGFAGEFAVKNRKLSQIISKKKAENIVKSGADYVITTCPACLLGLKQGLFGIKKPPKVLSLAEFINNLELLS